MYTALIDPNLRGHRAVRLRQVLRTRRGALIGLLVPMLLAAGVVERARAVAPPPALTTRGARRYGMTAAQRRRLFVAIASHEVAWRRSARRKFPRAPWSAEDDYHWHVQAHIERVLAKRAKMASSQVWGLYDEAVHDRWRLIAGSLAVPRPATATTAPIATTAPTATSTAALRATVVPLHPRQQ